MADRPDLFQSTVVQEIRDDATWKALVNEVPGPVLVEFFVTWCPHCQREAPILDELAPRLRAQGLEVYHANAEVMYNKGPVYQLEETPSFILVKNGQLVAKHEGFLEPAQLEAFAQGTLGEVTYLPGLEYSSRLFD